MVFADVLYAFLCLFWVEGTPYFLWCGCVEFNLRVERIGDSQFWTISELSCYFAHGLVQIKDAIFKTLIANWMFDNAHIRLTLTRGKKVKYRSRFTRMLFLQYVICYLLGITCFLIIFTGVFFKWRWHLEWVQLSIFMGAPWLVFIFLFSFFYLLFLHPCALFPICNMSPLWKKNHQMWGWTPPCTYC